MILNLGVPEVKIRNYEYCQFSLNYANITEKLRLFKMKFCRKNLAEVVEQFINYKIKTMEELWHILDGNNYRTRHPTAISDNLENNKKINRSLSKGLLDR